MPPWTSTHLLKGESYYSMSSLLLTHCNILQIDVPYIELFVGPSFLSQICCCTTETQNFRCCNLLWPDDNECCSQGFTVATWSTMVYFMLGWLLADFCVCMYSGARVAWIGTFKVMGSTWASVDHISACTSVLVTRIYFIYCMHITLDGYGN